MTNHKRASWTAIDILEAAPSLFPFSSSSSFMLFSKPLLLTHTTIPSSFLSSARPPPAHCYFFIFQTSSSTTSAIQIPALTPHRFRTNKRGSRLPTTTFASLLSSPLARARSLPSLALSLSSPPLRRALSAKEPASHLQKRRFSKSTPGIDLPAETIHVKGKIFLPESTRFGKEIWTVRSETDSNETIDVGIVVEM